MRGEGLGRERARDACARQRGRGALRAALPGASFAAEVDGLGGFIIDSEQYIDTIRSRSPGFAQRFLAGRQATPDFDHVFGASERIGWLRALPENATEADADALCERVADALTATAAAYIAGAHKRQRKQKRRKEKRGVTDTARR